MPRPIEKEIAIPWLAEYVKNLPPNPGLKAHDFENLREDPLEGVSDERIARILAAAEPIKESKRPRIRPPFKDRED